MEVIKTAIEGLLIIEPKVFKDSRGYFFESFSQREFEEKVCPINFVQDNESMSSYGGRDAARKGRGGGKPPEREKREREKIKQRVSRTLAVVLTRSLNFMALQRLLGLCLLLHCTQASSMRRQRT